jgi:hypothetical protein
MGAVDRSPPSLGGLDELERHRQAGHLGSGPLVTLARSRTVAKVDSIGLAVAVMPGSALHLAL